VVEFIVDVNFGRMRIIHAKDGEELVLSSVRA
jgi:hypothetical protein